MSDWEDYKSINPNDLGDTYQTIGTKEETQTNADGTTSTISTPTILDNFRVDDVDGKAVQQYSSKPETTTDASKSNTGSGLEAALGTDYSWNTKAKERAELDYKSAVLESKSNYLTNRQELESQGQQLQQQVDMQKYSINQSNEKAGWTGGYILDTERQMSYLKQTIQSQMYGQMELQRYGYDTSLAAARLAYDTNKYDLALEYYNTALSRAVSEAEITGYYVSPETSEMLNEYSIASRILNDATASEEDKLRADKVLTSVYKWFEDNGISKQGVETYSHIVEERTHKMSLDKIYEYQNDAQNQISKDTFVKVDENGNKIYGDIDVEKINFSNMSSTEIVNYIFKKDGSINEVAKDQYLSRLDTISYEMENNFTNWCKTQGYIDDKNKPDTSQDYQTLLSDYLITQDTASKLANEIQRLVAGHEEDAEHNNKVNQIVEGWEVAIKLPDNTFVTLTAKATGKNVETEEEFDASQYIKEYNGSIFLKDCKNATQLVQLLESEEMSAITSMLDLKFDDREAFMDSINNWSKYLKNIPGVSTYANRFNTITDIFTSYSKGGIIEMIDSRHFKQVVTELSGIIKEFKTSIGDKNFSILQAQANKFDKLSDKDKAFMDPTELATLEACASYIEKLDKMDKFLDYAKDYDSNMLTDPWDYIGDSWKQVGRVWDDGYQFGDVTKTVVQGTGSLVKTIGSTIVGGVKWIFGW